MIPWIPILLICIFMAVIVGAGRNTEFKPFFINELETGPEFRMVRPKEVTDVCKSVNASENGSTQNNR